MEPPSSILDDYFSTGILLILFLLVYTLISGIGYSYNFLFYVSQNKPEKSNRNVALLMSKPGFFHGTYLQFSMLFKLVIVFICYRLLNSTVAAAFLSMLFIYSADEIIKLVIKEREVSFFRKTVWFTLAMDMLSTPFNKILSRLTTVPEEEREEREQQSIEEITDDEESNNTIEFEQRQLLKNIISLSNTTVSDIMKPRVEVKAVNITMTSDQVLERAMKCGYSRLPVYDNNLDNIKGFLYVKDLVDYVQSRSSEYNWQKHIREAYFVPGIKKVSDLLEEFRQKKIHLALVVDEYGGTDGIVTLEDVLEEIVGEISDESDKIQ